MNTSRLDAADDDVVDFIVSDLLGATSKNISKVKMKFSTQCQSTHTCSSTSAP